MHILLITTYFEPDSGAAAVRLSRLARLLAADNHQMTILTAMPHYPTGRVSASYRRKFSVAEQQGNLRVVRAWRWATPSPKISRRLLSQVSFMLTAFLRGLALPRPDVVLIEGQPMFTGLAGSWLSRLKRVPYVVNVSDLWPDHLLSVGRMTERHPVYRILRVLVDGVYRGARGIVAMSPAWAEKIRPLIRQPERVQVIYNGVDLERFRPGLDASAFRLAHNLGSDPLVTFIGTFATQYNLEAMLAAAQALPQTQFVFIGEGSQADILREALATGNYANVRWLGWLPHAEVPLAWAASTVTMLAMRDAELYHGTIPAKFYEAFASGVPVAAMVEGVGAHMLTESGAGLVTDCHDQAGFTANLRRLLNDASLREQCAQAGRAYAESRFDPLRVARQYADVLADTRLADTRAAALDDTTKHVPEDARQQESAPGNGADHR